MSSTPKDIVTCNCPDCKQPLDYYLQSPLSPKSTRPAYWIGTCRTVGCELRNVTLEDSAWGTVDLEQYRKMNRQMAGAK